MKVLRYLALFFISSSSNAWASSPSDIVKQFIQAYNQHQLDEMLHLVSEDMQWLYNINNELVQETTSKNALKLTMQNYFKQHPKARSAIKDILAFGTRVVVVEEAFSNTNSLSQCALSIYQVEQKLITSVIYYEASACH